MELSQDQMDRLYARILSAAITQAEVDVISLRENGIEPSETLIRELARRQAEEAWKKLLVELQRKTIEHGMNIQAAVEELFGPACSDEDEVLEDDEDDFAYALANGQEEDFFPMPGKEPTLAPQPQEKGNSILGRISNFGNKLPRLKR